MPRQQQSNRRRDGDASGILPHLSPEESTAVLDHLIKRHRELRAEAEEFAATLVSSQSIDEIASAVYEAVKAVDLKALNTRAGRHSWGYMEPSEAAWELLDESIEEWVEDMKRMANLGFVSAAETVCAGIVAGLYQATNAQRDGALGWAPDFPIEESGHVLEELLRSSKATEKRATGERPLATLTDHTPEWADPLRGAVHACDK
ncbi:MAG: hypothetical protein L0Z50_36485 [Verrucomicrobiales bacterium]|nr:hypothetical protein [Verrucomicrobiales bacterium]